MNPPDRMFWQRNKAEPWKLTVSLSPLPSGDNIEYMQSAKVFALLKNPNAVDQLIKRGEIILPDKYNPKLHT